jgi:hypothetical protein
VGAGCWTGRRGGALADALAAGDAGLRTGSFTTEDVTEVIQSANVQRGTCRAERASRISTWSDGTGTPLVRK